MVVEGGDTMPCVVIGGEEYAAEKGSCLKEVLKTVGFSMSCGGNGLCGKCKVHISGEVSRLSDQERRWLTAEEIQQGIRLACYTHIEGDCVVSLPQYDMIYADMPNGRYTENADMPLWHYGVAVDIGTTTVAAVLCDGHGEILSQTTAVNPQAAWGADVLTRAQAATYEGERLVQAIQTCVNKQVQALCREAKIETADVDRMVVTGNTVMLCLYTATDVSGLTRAPFVSECLFDEYRTAERCGIQGLRADVQVYFPPCFDAFLGADFACAIQSVKLRGKMKTALVVDLGTNGEMALWHNGNLYACSTAAGPAFEGVGISCGLSAVCGAVDRVDVVNNRLEWNVIGGGEARGICGSGLIDVLAGLNQLQEIDNTGRLDETFCLTKDVHIVQSDIDALLLSKSAIRSGIETLLHTVGITPDDVETVYLAGGFGSALNIHSAIVIGLFPQCLSGRIRFVGNAALDGARQLLGGKKMSIPPTVHNVDLATNPYFADAFMRNMSFN